MTEEKELLFVEGSIQKHKEFITPEELYKELIARVQKYHPSDDISMIEKAFDIARTNTDFGNGRYVRNIFELAKMNQASRLLEKDFDDITSDEITTIIAEDIVIPENKRNGSRRIGFC